MAVLADLAGTREEPPPVTDRTDIDIDNFNERMKAIARVAFAVPNTLTAKAAR